MNTTAAPGEQGKERCKNNVTLAGMFPDRQTFRFRLTVDYDQPLNAMIKAGHYDWMNRNITADRFPLVGDGIVEVDACLFQFDCHLESQDVIEAIQGHGWRPASFEYLLSCGSAFPCEQLKRPIVGLGSFAQMPGNRRVPVLGKRGWERWLGLRQAWPGRQWHDDDCFLAVQHN